MSLSNSQYDAIMRSYEERRLANHHLLEERKKEVYEKIPAYRQLEQELGNISVEQSRKLIAGDAQALDVLHERIREIRARKESLLLENGFAADYLEPVYTCSICRDTGYVDGKKCKCLQQATIRVLYSQSNLEEVLERENFDNFSYEYYNDSDVEKMRQTVAECKAFVADFDKEYENLMLNGSVGVGKTFLTNCIARELLQTGHSVIYFTAFHLFETLAKYAFHSHEAGDDIEKIHEDIFTCDLLIIDDLGTEMTNSFVATQLFVILNERHNRKKSTLISTNLSLEELNDKYSERSFSRIFGYYKMLRIRIDDIRMAIRRNKNAQNRK